MAEDKLIWNGPYSLDDPKQVARIPEGAHGKLVILASNGPEGPQHQVERLEGEIRERLQAYIDDAKSEIREFKHGKMAEQFMWADVTRTTRTP